MAVVVLADHPEDVDKLPALKNVGFEARLDTDRELERLRGCFARFGVACRVVRGIGAFLRAAREGALFPPEASLKLVFDKTEGGGHRDGFGPARRSIGPLLCKQFGYTYCHGDAYSAAITRHKYHQMLVLKDAGVPTPRTWMYDVGRGWLPRSPERGQRVICKSTFEGWSIGVTEETIGPFTEQMGRVIRSRSYDLGQPVCVQEFLPGREIYVLVLEADEVFVAGMAEARSSTGPKAAGEVLVFEDHCRPGGIVYSEALGLGEPVTRALHRAAIQTFKALGMRGYGRVDFRVTPSGRIGVFDIADNPGTSAASSLSYILSQRGMDVEEIPAFLVGLCARRGAAAEARSGPRPG